MSAWVLFYLLFRIAVTGHAAVPPLVFLDHGGGSLPGVPEHFKEHVLFKNGEGVAAGAVELAGEQIGVAADALPVFHVLASAKQYGVGLERQPGISEMMNAYRLSSASRSILKKVRFIGQVICNNITRVPNSIKNKSEFYRHVHHICLSKGMRFHILKLIITFLRIFFTKRNLEHYASC